ncbi:hypothetical protein M513_14197 [Trichuris suis]|nr:hypothetical protein M513_14197 [Trichuris suis]
MQFLGVPPPCSPSDKHFGGTPSRSDSDMQFLGVPPPCSRSDMHFGGTPTCDDFGVRFRGTTTCDDFEMEFSVVPPHAMTLTWSCE